MAEPKVYLVSTQVEGKKYEIVKYDAESKVVTLKNKNGDVFEHPNFSKAEAERCGYKLEKEVA